MTKISDNNKKREYCIDDFYDLFNYQVPEKHTNKLNYFLLGVFAIGILSAVFFKGGL